MSSLSSTSILSAVDSGQQQTGNEGERVNDIEEMGQN